jgi:signal transduction histidine kinase
VAEKRQLKIQFTAFGGVEALENAERTVLYRVAQEALTNVVRHANATEVKLSIIAISNAIRMEISDNGKSFRVGNAFVGKNSKRLGLVGMNERVEMVGGTLVTESAPGHGTVVRAEIPYYPEKIKI